MHKTKTQILNLTTNTSNDTNTKLEIDNAEIQKFTKQTQIQKQKPKAKKYTTNIKIQKTPILHSNRCRSCGTCTMQGTCRCRRSLSAVQEREGSAWPKMQVQEIQCRCRRRISAVQEREGSQTLAAVTPTCCSLRILATSLLCLYFSPLRANQNVQTMDHGWGDVEFEIFCGSTNST